MLQIWCVQDKIENINQPLIYPWKHNKHLKNIIILFIIHSFHQHVLWTNNKLFVVLKSVFCCVCRRNARCVSLPFSYRSVQTELHCSSTGLLCRGRKPGLLHSAVLRSAGQWTQQTPPLAYVHYRLTLYIRPVSEEFHVFLVLLMS